MTDPLAAGLDDFARRLRHLKNESGDPSVRELVAVMKSSGHPFARSTISDKLRGTSLPSWDFVAAFISACLQHAQSLGIMLQEDLIDQQRWRNSYREMLLVQRSARSIRYSRKSASYELKSMSTPTAVWIHDPHLTADENIACRSKELEVLSSWGSQDRRNVLCIAGPGGQGKSALAWAHFNHYIDVAERSALWHGFGIEADAYSQLVTSLCKFAAQLSDDGPLDDVDEAFVQLEKHKIFVVLDGLDRLYGPSDRLADILTSPQRTITDVRIEALLRRLIANNDIHVTMTSRLFPSLLEDPVIVRRVHRLDLDSIDPDESGEFWRKLGATGFPAEYATAAVALRGNPLLMTLAARWLAARRESEIRVWLENNPDLIGSLLGNEEFQRAALSEAIAQATAEERSCLRLLAFSRRTLSRDEWENVARQDPENIHEFDHAILGLLERGLVQKDAAANFHMHDLLAETVIRSASDNERGRAYQALDADRGMELYMPRSRNASYYDLGLYEDNLLVPESDVAYLLSLLDRNLFDDAEHILRSRLQDLLRFRLGELRVLQSLMAEMNAAQLRYFGSLPSFRGTLEAELAIFDGRPTEAIRLLPESPKDFEAIRLMAEALAASGKFEHAYQEAQRACYLALRSLCLVTHAGYSGFQVLGEKPHLDYSRSSIDLVLAMRTLARVLSTAGYRYTALLVSSASLFFVENDQSGIKSMAYEELARTALELQRLDEAERYCQTAEVEARVMKVEEHVLNAAMVSFKIQACRGNIDGLGEQFTQFMVRCAKLGFGQLVVQGANLGEAMGATHAWLSDALAWRYEMDHGSADVPAGEAPSRGLAEELREIQPLHQDGQWLEWHILRTRIWCSDHIPEGVRTMCHSMFPDDTAAVHPEVLIDIESNEETIGNAAGRLKADESDSGSAYEALCQALEGDSTNIADIYERGLRAIAYDPENGEFRRRLLTVAERLGRADEAVSILMGIAEAQVVQSEISLEITNLFRRRGIFDTAAFFADAGHRATLSLTFAPAVPGIDIAHVLGCGLDLLTLGTDPAIVDNAVFKALHGSPLIYRHRSKDDSKRPVIRIMGTGKPATEYEPPESLMSEILEQQMEQTWRDIEDGSVEWTAWYCFKRVAVSRRPGLPVGGGRRYRRSTKEARMQVAQSLRMIEGYDETVNLMIKDLGVD